MPSVSPCLWFDGVAEDAASFYVATFQACGRSASVDDVTRWGDGGPGAPGSALTVDFTLDGLKVVALNGGSAYTFTPAVSLAVTCADQPEVDRFWAHLTSGGTPGRCGWLTDKFGLSWQVIPGALGALLQGEDPAGRARAMQALMDMTKLDLDELRRAYEGEPGA